MQLWAQGLSRVSQGKRVLTMICTTQWFDCQHTDCTTQWCDFQLSMCTSTSQGHDTNPCCTEDGQVLHVCLCALCASQLQWWVRGTRTHTHSAHLQL